jgi:hypothetical protein
VAASLAVSHFDVCGTSEKLEIGTTVGLFNQYSNVLGITAYAGVFTPTRESQCVGRLSPDTASILSRQRTKAQTILFERVQRDFLR